MASGFVDGPPMAFTPWDDTSTGSAQMLQEQQVKDTSFAVFKKPPPNVGFEWKPEDRELLPDLGKDLGKEPPPNVGVSVPEWEPEVRVLLPHFGQKFSPYSALAPSLMCFSVMQPGGQEQVILEFQLFKRAGIFA